MFIYMHVNAQKMVWLGAGVETFTFIPFNCFVWISEEYKV